MCTGVVGAGAVGADADAAAVMSGCLMCTGVVGAAADNRLLARLSQINLSRGNSYLATFFSMPKKEIIIFFMFFNIRFNSKRS